VFTLRGNVQPCNENWAAYFRGPVGNYKKILHTEEDLEGVFARSSTAEHDDVEENESGKSTDIN
jgi:hypothetical protein